MEEGLLAAIAQTKREEGGEANEDESSGQGASGDGGAIGSRARTTTGEFMGSHGGPLPPQSERGE